MKRIVSLLGVVIALAFSSTAAADTFAVAQPHQRGASFSPGITMAFTVAQPHAGPMSFASLRTIWQSAGNSYGIPWEVLAAINKVETNFGSNLGPSSAGAVGWMQFMPSTWARWGLDANGDGVADPDNPTDAIFSAARYLAACGGQFDIAGAVHCYNHSDAYVSEVLTLAAQYGNGGTGELLSFHRLQGQLVAARARAATSKRQLVPALAQARDFSAAERRANHTADHAHLLSDQLEARKRAVLIAVRRDAADARVSRLRRRLHAATAQVTKLENQAGSATFGSSDQLLSAPVGAAQVHSGQYGGAVSIALQYLGVPYVWGGASPSGFDCSGLVQYVFAQVGILLPHNTVAQWVSPNAMSVPRNQLQPGDLVFFNGLDHVGIYIGNGEFIDAPHTGADVRIDSLGEGWYAANYDGAKRIVGASLDSAAMSAGTVAFAPAGSNAFVSDVVYFTH